MLPKTEERRLKQTIAVQQHLLQQYAPGVVSIGAIQEALSLPVFATDDMDPALIALATTLARRQHEAAIRAACLAIGYFVERLEDPTANKRQTCRALGQQARRAMTLLGATE